MLKHGLAEVLGCVLLMAAGVGNAGTLGFDITSCTYNSQGVHVTFQTDQPPPYTVGVYRMAEYGLGRLYPLGKVTSNLTDCYVPGDFRDLGVFVQVGTPDAMQSDGVVSESSREAYRKWVKEPYPQSFRQPVFLPSEWQDLKAVGEDVWTGFFRTNSASFAVNLQLDNSKLQQVTVTNTVTDYFIEVPFYVKTVVTATNNIVVPGLPYEDPEAQGGYSFSELEVSQEEFWQANSKVAKAGWSETRRLYLPSNAAQHDALPLSFFMPSSSDLEFSDAAYEYYEHYSIAPEDIAVTNTIEADYQYETKYGTVTSKWHYLPIYNSGSGEWDVYVYCTVPAGAGVCTVTSQIIIDCNSSDEFPVQSASTNWVCHAGFDVDQSESETLVSPTFTGDASVGTGWRVVYNDLTKTVTAERAYSARVDRSDEYMIPRGFKSMSMHNGKIYSIDAYGKAQFMDSNAAEEHRIYLEGIKPDNN